MATIKSPWTKFQKLLEQYLTKKYKTKTNVKLDINLNRLFDDETHIAILRIEFDYDENNELLDWENWEEICEEIRTFFRNNYEKPYFTDTGENKNRYKILAGDNTIYILEYSQSLTEI